MRLHCEPDLHLRSRCIYFYSPSGKELPMSPEIIEAVLVPVPTTIWWLDEIEDHLPQSLAFAD